MSSELARRSDVEPSDVEPSAEALFLGTIVDILAGSGDVEALSLLRSGYVSLKDDDDGSYDSDSTPAVLSVHVPAAEYGRLRDVNQGAMTRSIHEAANAVMTATHPDRHIRRVQIVPAISRHADWRAHTDKVLAELELRTRSRDDIPF